MVFARTCICMRVFLSPPAECVTAGRKCVCVAEDRVKAVDKRKRVFKKEKEKNPQRSTRFPLSRGHSGSLIGRVLAGRHRWTDVIQPFTQ